MADTVAAPTDTQQTGTATYTGRHRDPWNRHAEAKDYDWWYAALVAREERRKAQNGGAR